MRHVVMFSGGAGSWATAKLVAEAHGTEHLTLLFANTKMEDDDTYRFLHEAAKNVGGELVVTAEGRDIWQVFRDVRFLGNHRLDPCSRVLKREHLRRWLEDNCDPGDTTVYLGIDWTEEHRFVKAARHWDPWQAASPLVERTDLDKASIITWAREEGLPLPRLYDLGFPHANCGGGCVKAGMAHWKLVLAKLPEVYRRWESAEEEFRTWIDKDVAFLTDRSGGRRRPLTLAEFRLRQGETLPGHDDWGACSCMSEPETEGDQEPMPETNAEFDAVFGSEGNPALDMPSDEETFDFDPSEAVEFARLVPGTYHADIVERPEKKYSQNGNPMMVVKFFVTDKDFYGATPTRRFMLNGKGGGWTKEFLKAIGLTDEAEGKKPISPSAVTGRRCIIKTEWQDNLTTDEKGNQVKVKSDEWTDIVKCSPDPQGHFVGDSTLDVGV